MSETIGSEGAAGSGRTVQGGGSGGTAGTGARNSAEAYAFACMNCGFGWEQAYEIEHHVDLEGRPYVTYLADGVRVPSPLTRPACPDCDGHHVRIMRAGQVSGIASRGTEPHAERAVHRPRHWSIARFLHRGHGEAGSA
jgi:hypothetical protein